MRRFRSGFLVLTVLAGVSTAVAAADGSVSEPPPSLEYRPPRLVIPEPKAPHPLPPMTIFRQIIGRGGMLTGSFDGPVDVARDANDNFYVLDAGNSRVQKFDSLGKFVDDWGSRGIRAGEFIHPSAIVVVQWDPLDPLSEYVYVVDTGNDRIQQFDIDGEFVASWGSRGNAEGDFKSPRDIAIDPDPEKGGIFILDSGNERVQKFRAAGGLKKNWEKWEFEYKWERLSFKVTGGVFADLTSIAYSDERFGYMYLLGAGCVVQQFSLGPDGRDGTLVNSWPAIAPESGLCVPARIEVDKKNHYVYVLDSGNSQLVLFNADGLYRAALRGAEVSFSKPLGFAVDADGEEFLVADTENNIIQKFTMR